MLGNIQCNATTTRRFAIFSQGNVIAGDQNRIIIDMYSNSQTDQTSED